MSASKRSKRVREPLQVYLTEVERAKLDRLAAELGISRAEALRRGIDALRDRHGESFYEAFSRLIGSIDSPDLPPDLAEHHDEYLAQDREERMAKFSRPSS